MQRTFLGFVHLWGKTRRGKATTWQRTAKDRLARTLKAINQQCRYMRSWSLAEQQRRLSRMLEGHFAYFGITGNYRRLAAVVHQTRRLCASDRPSLRPMRAKLCHEEPNARIALVRVCEE